MKLRLHENSLRLRLSRTDVARLMEKGGVDEAVTFAGTERLSYRIETGAAPGVMASFQHASIIVTVPEVLASRWAASDEVGMEGSSGPLKILIEKDFACLDHPNAEADADAGASFPNPAAKGRRNAEA